MSTDGLGSKRRRNIAENFNQLSRVHERYRHTNDRQTDGRQHIANVYSERRLLIMGRVTCPRFFWGSPTLSWWDWNLSGSIRFPVFQIGRAIAFRVQNIWGGPNIWPCLFRGAVWHATVNLCTNVKFLYWSMPKIGNVTQNWENMVVWSSRGHSVTGNRSTTSYISLHNNYVLILHRFREIDRD